MSISLTDILDLRAYERRREEFRREIIALKKIRRIGVGEFVTLVFENRETVLFQIQEMARAERMLDDSSIQSEIDAYGSLIPQQYQLTATMFIELRSKGELEYWLPRLANVERCVSMVVGGHQVSGKLEGAHESQLTRPEVTASVHYLTFDLGARVGELFKSNGGEMVIDHPNYQARTTLQAQTVQSLVSQWGSP